MKYPGQAVYLRERMIKRILKSRTSIHLFALMALCLAVFANTLGNDFVWEDQRLVVDNRHIRDYKNIPLFFTADHWKESRQSAPDTGFRPLRETSFAVDYWLWELDPRGYHLTNLLLHMINTVLAYCLALMLMAAASDDKESDVFEEPGFLSPAFLTALFFALHPIHTESVAYIKNRSDLLAFIFFQGACLFFFIFLQSRALKKKRLLYYAGALACFLLSLWSKPMALTLPLVLTLYIVCFPKNRSLSNFIFGTLPFFVLGLAYFFFERSFLIAADPVRTGFDPGSWRHAWTITTSLVWYLKMLVWPAPLNIYHLFHPHALLSDVAILLMTATLLMILYVFFKNIVAKRIFVFGLGWIMLTLVPVINIFVLEARPIAEQRLYIPSFGFCLALALVVIGIKPPGFSKSSRVLFPALITVLICLTCVVITVQRNFEWRGAGTLFSSSVNRSPKLAWAHDRLGFALREEGRLDEAVFHYRKALMLNPSQAGTYNALGAILGEKGELDEAIRYFEAALQIQPFFALAHDNLGLALSRQGRVDEAIYHYRMAVEQEPGNAWRRFHLAEALAAKGDSDEAIYHYERAFDLDPDGVLIHRRLKAVLLEKGDRDNECRGQ